MLACLHENMTAKLIIQNLPIKEKMISTIFSKPSTEYTETSQLNFNSY